MNDITITVLRSENLHLNSISKICSGFNAPKMSLKRFIQETWEAASILPRVKLFYGEQFSDMCQSAELLIEKNGEKYRADFILEPLAMTTSFYEWTDFVKEEIEKSVEVNEVPQNNALFQAFKDIATYIGRQS
jgi:hypothetical protein